LALLIWTLIGACTGSETTRGGAEITDSAGVVLVRNLGNADWSAVPRPALVEDLRIGVVEGAPEYQFGAASGLDVDVGADGRIYVLDRQASNVRVFSPSGDYLMTMGRRGQGPGELSGGTAVMVTPGDTVWVVDGYPLARRLVAFTPNGEAAGTLPLALEDLPDRWEPSSRGVFLVQLRRDADDRPIILAALNPQTGSIDTVLALEPVERTRSGVLYDATPTWALLEGGRIVGGRSDEHRLVVSNRAGSIERVITRATPRRPISDTEREAAIEARREVFATFPTAGRSPEALRRIQEDFEQQIANTTVADYWPAYTTIMSGPGGTLWTRRFFTPAEVEAAGEEGIPNLWDVYDTEGRLLGPIELPRSFSPRRTVGDHLYGIAHDELGVSYVVKLRFALPT
jgi:hypothetical protein